MFNDYLSCLMILVLATVCGNVLADNTVPLDLEWKKTPYSNLEITLENDVGFFKTPIDFIYHWNGFLIKQPDTQQSLYVNFQQYYQYILTDINDMDRPQVPVNRVIFKAGVTGLLHNVDEIFPPGVNDYLLYLANSSGGTLSPSSAKLVASNAVEVEFHGAGGDETDPLTIFIERGLNFTDVDLSNFQPQQALKIAFCSENSGIQESIEKWRLKNFSVYDETGKTISKNNSSLQFDKNCFSLLIDPIEKMTGSVIGFTPTIMQVSDNIWQSHPKSGWYSVSIFACDKKSGKSCQPLSTGFTANYTPTSTPLLLLMTKGPTYTQFGNAPIYRESKFYVIKDINDNGRVKLQTYATDGNFNIGNLSDFNMSSVSNGGINPNSNRVRWISRSYPNIQTGYLSDISDDGFSATLEKDDPAASYPANDSIIVLEQEPIIRFSDPTMNK
ncbi:MAG: hypothetical protein ACPGUD_03740 [Parashewanella sp.]